MDTDGPGESATRRGALRYGGEQLFDRGHVAEIVTGET